jgi:hypothetical protein
MAVRPTPTQSENDRAALGEHILEHEDDGSGPEPHAQQVGKQMEAGKPAQTYQTRTVAPSRTRSE